MHIKKQEELDQEEALLIWLNCLSNYIYIRTNYISFKSLKNQLFNNILLPVSIIRQAAY